MRLNYKLGEVAAMSGAGLATHDAETIISGVSTDTRTLQAGDIFFALRGERHDGDRFVKGAFAMGAAAAVTHTSHEDGPCLVVTDPLEALQRFAAMHRLRCEALVIAITGSCGKTTSKDMIAALLGEPPAVVKTPGNLNNEIGCPLSLLAIEGETRYAVIEMGANHSGEIARMCRMAQPRESAVTMVAPAHLEGFGSIENIARAKGEIMEALPPDGCFYINMDDPFCRAIGERFGGDKVRFGSQGDVVLEGLTFAENGEMVLTIAPIGRLRLPLRVRAHATNVLLAVAVGLRHGVSDFEGALRNACANMTRFRTLLMDGVTILDDTYNANPASMAAAFDTLKEQAGGKKIAVLGSMFELGDAAPQLHRETGALAVQMGVRRLIALGPNAADMAAGARDAGLDAVDTPETHEEAAALLYTTMQPDGIVLIKGSRGMRMENIIEMLREMQHTGHSAALHGQ